MSWALGAACVVVGGYWITGEIINAPVKKEIRWQMFEIAGMQGAMPNVSDDAKVKFAQEISERVEVIRQLDLWLTSPLPDRLRTEIPRNNLCQYV